MIDAAVRKVGAARTAATGETRPEEYLGPAQVVEARPHEVLVSLPELGMVAAALAFSMPYTPVVDDVLLVIGRGGKHYAIGVLHGAGRTAFTIQGDVDLHSVNGKLSLSGDRGVEVRGPEVDIYTVALRMVARDVTHKFESLCQRVTSLFRVHAGETQTLVDEGSVTQAKRAAILTEETVTINGREVHLG
jgi:hypothetical protein